MSALVAELTKRILFSSGTSASVKAELASSRAPMIFVFVRACAFTFAESAPSTYCENLYASSSGTT